MLNTAEMLSENFNENEQAEAKKQVSLNLRVSYTNELTNKLNKAFHFVTKKIGFKSLEEFTFIKGLQYLKLRGANGKTLTIQLEITTEVDVLASSDALVLAKVNFVYEGFIVENYLTLELDRSQNWKITRVNKFYFDAESAKVLTKD